MKYHLSMVIDTEAQPRRAVDFGRLVGELFDLRAGAEVTIDRAILEPASGLPPYGTTRARGATVWREVARAARRGEAVSVVDPKAGGPE